MTAATLSLSLARPAPVAVPRGAVWVGWMADLVVAWRVRQELDRRARDAASLRRWAQRLQMSEPSLAADLRAAADRHSEGC
jgi:hypothetical protein